MPVIATNVGGIPEVIRNEVDGFLSEVGNIEEMTNFAVKILGDDSLRRRMGKSAREIAKERFCPTKIIPTYETIYRKVLDQGTW